jgi:hypothetical protein
VAIMLDKRHQLAQRRNLVRATRGFDCYCSLCMRQLLRNIARCRTVPLSSAHMPGRDAVTSPCGGSGLLPTPPEDAACSAMSAQRHRMVERMCLPDLRSMNWPKTSLDSKLHFYDTLLGRIARQHLHLRATTMRATASSEDQSTDGNGGGGDDDDDRGRHNGDAADGARSSDRGLGMFDESPFMEDDNLRYALLQWFVLFTEASFTDPVAYGNHLDSAHCIMQCVNQAVMGRVPKDERRRPRWRYMLDSAYALLRIQQHRMCISRATGEALDAHGRAIQFVFCVAAEQLMPVWLSALCLMAAAQFDNMNSVLVPTAETLAAVIARNAVHRSLTRVEPKADVGGAVTTAAEARLEPVESAVS